MLSSLGRLKCGIVRNESLLLVSARQYLRTCRDDNHTKIVANKIKVARIISLRAKRYLGNV